MSARESQPGDAASLKRLEGTQALLMYEEGVDDAHADVVRVGQIRDVKLRGHDVTFRFTETGRISRERVLALAHQLQMGEWDKSRTHWAVKDGDIPGEVLGHMTETPKQYDVVFSFAGENRAYVEQVADLLIAHGVEVFYDRYETVTLWGKDLAEHFESVYRKQARFCVMFISSHYADKIWTKHERRSALARAMVERKEYVLPARFDDTEIPGLSPTVHFVDLRALNPEQFGELVLQKLGRPKA